MPLTCIVHPFSTAPNGLLTSLVALVQPSGFTVRAGDIMYTYLSAETLERQTRPYLSNTVPQIQAHGGHFDIEDVDEATGDVTIAIGGACSGCEIAPMTMRAIRDRLCSTALGRPVSVPSPLWVRRSLMIAVLIYYPTQTRFMS